MRNYQCLVLDHDDTVVCSNKTINYPSMQEVLQLMRPGKTITFEAFMLGCFRKTFSCYCTEDLSFTEEEQEKQFEMWKQYVATHIPPAYEGMAQLLRRFRAEGGKICVSSHSSPQNISRDYRVLFGFQPDMIFGWELGEDKRKPAPYALLRIMEEYDLRPEQLLMVDDMRSGYAMAHACGVPFACAGWAHEFPEMIAGMKETNAPYLKTVDELSRLVFA